MLKVRKKTLRNLASFDRQPSLLRLVSLRRPLVESWRAEPVSMVVNLHRRRGSERSAAFIEFLSQRYAKTPFRSLAALTALLAEDSETLEERLRGALEGRVSSRGAKILADIAITAGHVELAEQFSKSMTSSDPGARLTRAKLLWHNGELTKAIDELTGSNHRVRRLREFYEAEREVFGGWRPSLESLEDYQPLPNVVLHLLTNSLPHTSSGYTQRSHSLLVEQAKAGVEVHAVTRLGYPQSIGVSSTHGVDVVDGIKYHRMTLDGPRSNLRDHHQQEAEELLKLVQTIRPSVIHTTTHFVNGLVANAVARAAGIPWIYEVRGQLSDTWASKRGPDAVNSERYLSFKREEVAVARSADAVITIGQQMKDLLVAREVSPQSISMSPNAVGDAFLIQPKHPSIVREELGLTGGSVFIGTVSSLVEYEGLETLIYAYALLRKKRADIRLLIVGDGDAGMRLRRTASELELDPSNIFMGRVSREEAVKFHQALDIFVVPRNDLLVTRAVTPLKPVEAMAMERPVVASDLPALREIVSDGITGILVPPADPEKLANAIEVLVDDAALRSRMGKAGRELVLLNRTWSGSVKASLDLYDRFFQEKRTDIG